MLTEAEALDRILAGIPTPQSELVPLPEAAGRWLTEDVRAGIALPGFDHAAMDGYALHADDCGKAGIALTVCGEQPAGRDLGLHVRPGVVVRIFTGAPLPGATGAVIMQEDVARTGASITVLEAARPGEWIRRAGSDVCAVQLIAARGDRLSPALLGAMAGQGMVSATAGRLPRVAIICTGGELISPGLPLPHHGCLYNSNGPMLASMMNGCAMALPPDTVVDELASLTYLLQTRLMECDAVITVGGASVGEHDLVRPALEAAGMPLEFWRVNVKPGKPFLFSSCGGKVVFGLPGNPVSAFVTAWLFVYQPCGAWLEQRMPHLSGFPPLPVLRW